MHCIGAALLPTFSLPGTAQPKEDLSFHLKCLPLSSLCRWQPLPSHLPRPSLSTSQHPQLPPARLCPVPPSIPRPSWRLTSELCTGRGLSSRSGLRDAGQKAQRVGSSTVMASSGLPEHPSIQNPLTPPLARHCGFALLAGSICGR